MVWLIVIFAILAICWKLVRPIFRFLYEKIVEVLVRTFNMSVGAAKALISVIVIIVIIILLSN